MRYSLLLLADEPSEGQISQEDITTFQAEFARYAESLEKAGVLISAEILKPSHATTTVSLRGGQLQIQDGPIANTKEQLGGTFVIDVPDLDAALAWAEKCPGAQYGVIEVRPSATVFQDGKWQLSA